MKANQNTHNISESHAPPGSTNRDRHNPLITFLPSQAAHHTYQAHRHPDNTTPSRDSQAAFLPRHQRHAPSPPTEKRQTNSPQATPIS